MYYEESFRISLTAWQKEIIQVAGCFTDRIGTCCWLYDKEELHYSLVGCMTKRNHDGEEYYFPSIIEQGGFLHAFGCMYEKEEFYFLPVVWLRKKNKYFISYMPNRFSSCH